MRLTADQRQLIQSAVRDHFGSGCRLWLFGSRVDDSARGGDIDLYLEVEDMSAADLVEHRLQLAKDLHLALGDQKIDLVIRRRAQGQELPVHRLARESGVRLQ